MSKYVITDLNWYSNLLEFISSGKKSSAEFEKLSQMIGNDVPVITLNELKDYLKQNKVETNEQVL